ncbi:MAG: ABC transporter ATP-binding protein [Eubacteriales bacterium]|nr:ABC transporter ATP-binding protein [Eubacteriales bacterium]
MKEKLRAIFEGRSWANIISWSKSGRRAVMALSVLDLFISVLSLLVALVTKNLINAAVSHETNGFVTYAVVLSILIILNRVVVFLYSRISAHSSIDLSRTFREMVLSKIMKKRYSEVAGYHSEEIVNRMNTDVCIVKDGILELVPRLLSICVSFFGAVWILITIDWQFVVLLVGCGILGLVVTFLLKEPMKRMRREMRENEAYLYTGLQETLTNLKAVKAGSAEDEITKRIEKREKGYVLSQRRDASLSITLNTVLGSIFRLSWLFCMIWGCRGIYLGYISYGALVAVIQLIALIQDPVSEAAQLIGQAYSMVTSEERLSEIIDKEEEESAGDTDMGSRYDELKAISLKDVHFSYDREKVFDGADLTIIPGKTYAVMGMSGCGKSTLFNLILGLYKPDSGTVSFEFNDEVREAGALTRKLISYVPQGNMLFEGTIRENLTMFNPGATEEEINEAISLSCMDGIIGSLEDGLDTVLGERGAGLSEGQAQRLAIARALLTKAPILLLDEATSALDEKTEAKLVENIRSLKGVTCLIITHRRAVLPICDNVIGFNEKKVTVSENKD